MALVVDTGGLIAFDGGDRQVAALLEATRRRRDRVFTSSVRGSSLARGGRRQALLAQLARGVTEVELDRRTSRTTGNLCGISNTTDVVDAHVAPLARDGDVVLTTDVDDLRRLLEAKRTHAGVLHC